MKEKKLKVYRLDLFEKNGDLIDGTFLHNIIDRKDAIQKAKRILIFQGISHLKFKLKIKK